MSLAKRLAEKRTRRKTRSRRAVSTQLEPDERLDSWERGAINAIAAEASRAAAEVIAERARENLRAHNSQLTGTDALRSERTRAKRHALGPTLAEQVQVVPSAEGGFEVVLHPDVAWIGFILEGGRTSSENFPARYWGNEAVDAETVRRPHPWLRPAYDEARAEAEQAMAKVFREAGE